MILHYVLLNRRTGDVRAGCDVVHSGSMKLVDSSSGSKFSRMTIPLDLPSQMFCFSALSTWCRPESLAVVSGAVQVYHCFPLPRATYVLRVSTLTRLGSSSLPAIHTSDMLPSSTSTIVWCVLVHRGFFYAQCTFSF